MTIAQQKYLRHGVKYLLCLGTLDESSALDRAILQSRALPRTVLEPFRLQPCVLWHHITSSMAFRMALRPIAFVMLPILGAYQSLSQMSSVSVGVVTEDHYKGSRAGYAWPWSLLDGENEPDTGRRRYSVFCVSIGLTCCGDKQRR